MKSSRITFAVVAGILAIAGLLVVSAPLQLGSLTSVLGYFAVGTVVALVVGDYRLTSRRLSPVSK